MSRLTVKCAPTRIFPVVFKVIFFLSGKKRKLSAALWRLRVSSSVIIHIVAFWCFVVCALADVITIDKTNENFRMIYDTKGRFVPHKIHPDEAQVKLSFLATES